MSAYDLLVSVFASFGFVAFWWLALVRLGVLK